MNNNQFDYFLELLQNVKGENLFNPYTDICSSHDLGSLSPKIRTGNLKQYFTTINKADTILIGEAAGYLGCRRTGLPFTDEITLRVLSKLFRIHLFVATKSGKNKELSATQMWGILSKLEHPPFLWNIVPFHPHEKNKPLSNRTPTPKDHELVKEAVKYFFDNTQFKKIFSVGNVSTNILTNMGYDVEYIRHPSYGGSVKFKTKILENFQLKEKKTFEKWI